MSTTSPEGKNKLVNNKQQTPNLVGGNAVGLPNDLRGRTSKTSVRTNLDTFCWLLAPILDIPLTSVGLPCCATCLQFPLGVERFKSAKSKGAAAKHTAHNGHALRLAPENQAEHRGAWSPKPPRASPRLRHISSHAERMLGECQTYTSLGKSSSPKIGSEPFPYKSVIA